MELVHDGDAHRPNAELTGALTTLAPQRGLILLSCGFYGNVIRFLPALTISDELIDEGLDILGGMLDELASVEQTRARTG
jgi:4-aminobutyrate aminotransferase/(S)-3-amino-2-methylpropionate transaminase